MTHPSKSKGNTFEREVVNFARGRGFEAQRAYASNGESLGLGAEVDLVIDDKPIQAKRRARLPAYLHVPQDCDAVVFREDRGRTYVMITLVEYLRILQEGKENDSPPNT